ncbi:hypothetical protein [Paenibacillus eucommiae]|uniref:ABC transporter permease n=1 Tax=Paenibacillus eucommiae TaxID=1355755 RepID=A0ABS4J1C4_9BACL|nr:hypothetical protein [Paenibacillus eucommiae]MBP1993637.1 hypothetical protein [Paenibacillus eucommiae]
MSIYLYELKKAFTSPVILTLTAVFFAFNLLLIFSHIHVKDDLKILNKLVDRFGYAIDTEMQNDFQNDYSAQLSAMNELTQRKIGQTYAYAGDFFEYENYNRYVQEQPELYSPAELDFIHELRVIEMYLYKIQDIDSTYNELDLMMVATSEIGKYGLSGQAAETVRKQYAKLSERLDTLIANGEHKNLFFMGPIYQMHTKLFKTLLRTMLFEIMILVVLITGYVSKYEFENKTHLLAYSTKRGRKLAVDKLLVSLAASGIVTTIVVGLTFAAYFIIYDYSGLWHVPISSFFNAEKLPYISWWKMSFISFLLCSVVLAYACQLLFSAMTFVLSTFIRNSYLVFTGFAILFGVILLLPSFVPFSSNAILLSVFTPFNLTLNPQRWFMEGGAFGTFKYYELITVSVWSLLLVALCWLSIRRFMKQSID